MGYVSDTIGKKVQDFLDNKKSIEYLDLDLFSKIDQYKPIGDIPREEVYDQYINDLPKLDYEDTIRISREVYQLIGKENEFTEILNELISNNVIIFNSNDANERFYDSSTDSIILTGTYFDVILLCHEIGHIIGQYSFSNEDPFSQMLFRETPSIIIEGIANDYIVDKYGIDISAFDFRAPCLKETLGVSAETNAKIFADAKKMFSFISDFEKNGKLNFEDMFQEIIKNQEMKDFLMHYGTSISACVNDYISYYTYDIGYIIGNYSRYIENKVELLDLMLKYRDCGIDAPFTIDEELIKDAYQPSSYTR